MRECSLGEIAREMRKDRRGGKEQDPTRYVAAWSENEVMDDGPCKAFVLILRTKGCRWAKDSGCTFCGYVNDTLPDVGSEELGKQFDRALDRYDKEPFFKIYTSGSFLDDEEVPPDFQEKVMTELFKRGVKKLLVETLPRYATKEKVGWLLDRFLGDDGIEFALGLESADPDVLRHSINKPGKVEDFIEAAHRIRELGGRTRIYIVIKPPLLTEREALEDAVASAEAVKDVADTISFNPINVQRGTVVERLWRRREYQPPWLWTVVDVLRRTAGLGPRVMSGPTGGGTLRGAHNCKTCDRLVLRDIQRFSTSGDVKDLEGSRCRCTDLWKEQLEIEDDVHGPFFLDRRGQGSRG